MKIYFPPKYNVPILEDPINYYYIPFFRSFFIKRVEIVLSFAKDKNFGKVLDIGCGTGVLFPEYSRRCESIVGIDIFLQDYSIRGLCKKEGITCSLAWGSILEVPFKDETFDTVVCISTLEHIEDSGKALTDIKRVLKPRGSLLAGFPVKNKITDKLLGQSTGFHVASHNQILAAARKVFGDVRVKRIPSIVPLDYSLYCAFEGWK